ncbi:Crp/Fnr family transcriptional regulator [uncultured Algoriphagus sp.]|uniref:Crp/Fnr family transcriptional regulator n=1 Tax=uncultured Algoriphagus sp. TaxID=417365 RepID=UPI0030ECB401
MIPAEFKESLPVFTDPDLVDQILNKGQLMKLDAGKVLMEPGQFMKMVPIVLEGSIKISRMDDEGRELFLYYLDAGETCALSLTCCSASKPSEIKAVVEEDATIISIPIAAIDQFSNDYKQWKDFVTNTYQNRFQEMLFALDAVAFKRMDERLMGYIVKKMKQLKTNELHTTHQEIANELTTSREVVSRLLKQLEKKKWIELGRNVIYIRDDFEELISK